MKFTILQLPFENDLSYRSYKYTRDHGGPNISDYKEVYSGYIHQGVKVDHVDVERILEQIYMRFQRVDGRALLPVEFTGHSMSVSDMVLLEGEGLFFCDSIGFRQIV